MFSQNRVFKVPCSRCFGIDEHIQATDQRFANGSRHAHVRIEADDEHTAHSKLIQPIFESFRTESSIHALRETAFGLRLWSHPWRQLRAPRSRHESLRLMRLVEVLHPSDRPPRLARFLYMLPDSAQRVRMVWHCPQSFTRKLILNINHQQRLHF